MWFDDPRPSIYVPHLTILNTDPKWDAKLRKQILKRQATPVRRTEKRNKRGGKGGKGNKGGRSKRGENERDESHSDQSDDEQEIQKDPFGWDYNLFRDTRREFAKFSFGVQPVQFFELQANYKCVQRVNIDGQTSILQDTQVDYLKSDNGSVSSESGS